MWFQDLDVPDNSGPKELQLFVDGVARFLTYVVVARSDAEFGFLWNLDSGPAARDARAELHAAARESLKGDVLPALYKLRGALVELAPGAEAEHGLTGSALRFKLLVVKAVTLQWENEHRGGKRTTPGWFRKLVDVIDAVLDSAIHASGHGGLIKEFKDALGALA